MPDRIHLFDVQLDCHIGVPLDERARAQPLFADLSVEFDTREAAATDDFTRTIDYAAVLDCMRRVASERSYALVETLVERIATAVLAEFPVASVRVLMRKPEALRARGVGAPAVEIERRRA